MVGRTKSVGRLLLPAVLVLLAGVAGSETPAACGKARAVFSASPSGSSYFFTPGHPFAPEADYPRTAGGGSTTYYLAGVFWSFGGGNPVVGLGNDSGAFAGTYPYDGPSWLQPKYHGSFSAFIGGGHGHWRVTEVDGCIDRDGSDRRGPDADECLVVLLTDQGKQGQSYFAVLSNGPDGIDDFRFTTKEGFPGKIPLAPIPGPEIVRSGAGSPGSMALDVTLPAVERKPDTGFYLHCRGAEILDGYRLYARKLPPGGKPPVQLNSQAVHPKWGPELPPWEPLTPEKVAIGEVASVELPCRTGERVLLCATLTFGGVARGAASYELANCSASSAPIACTPGVPAKAGESE